MSKKIDLETVAQLLSTESDLPQDQVKALVHKMQQVLQEEADAKPEPTPAAKFLPYVLFIPGPCPEESVAFLVEYDSNMDHHLVYPKLLEAIRDVNATAKKKGVFTELADVVEKMSRKGLKEKGLKLRYRGPMLIKQVDNVIEGAEDTQNEADA